MTALQPENVSLAVNQPEDVRPASLDSSRSGGAEPSLPGLLDCPTEPFDGGAPALEPALPVLRILSVNNAPADHVLALGRNMVGRHPHNHVVLSAWFVSRWHCEIQVYPNGRCLIQDLASTYGVCVNGERVVALMPLRYGDEIRVGAQRCLLLRPDNQTARTELVE